MAGLPGTRMTTAVRWLARATFEAADQLRGSVESAEYKHLVLDLLFLKYVSDSFERGRRPNLFAKCINFGRK